MTEIGLVSFSLSRGYTDPDKVVHRDVTFGRRVTALDLFNLDGNPLAQGDTRYNTLIVRSAITKFGNLPMPVPVEVLLSLTRTDREDLINRYNRFARESAGERKGEFISPNKVQLAFGFNINGLVYDTVEYGSEVTGFDEVAADDLGLTGLSHECYLIGREIKRLSQSKSVATLDGPIDLQFFHTLDAADLLNLRLGSVAWRNSFRGEQKAVQGEHGVAGDNASDSNKGVESRPNTQAS